MGIFDKLISCFKKEDDTSAEMQNSTPETETMPEAELETSSTSAPMAETTDSTEETSDKM
jgi:hypothetical protein